MLVVVNTNIRGFPECVFFLSVSSSAIIGNNISDCANAGIYIQSSSNITVLNNHISQSGAWAIALLLSSNNMISRNSIENNYGSSIWISLSSNANTITQNNVFGNSEEIGISDSSGNLIFHNNFVNNTEPAYLGAGSINVWDNGIPSGGNFWSRYTGVDVKRGLTQDLPGSDGIGDTYYVVGSNNTDHYPLMGLFGSPTATGENVTVFPVDDICLIFESVTEEGLTIVEKPDGGPPPPSGLSILQYYVIETTADYSGQILIRIVYVEPPPGMLGNTTQEGSRILQCVMLAGDVDEDFNVDIFDLVRLAGVYGVAEPDPRYGPNSNCDLDGDGDIDILDVVRLAANYGKAWDPETGWDNITTWFDPETNSIFGVTQHLSIFGVT